VLKFKRCTGSLRLIIEFSEDGSTLILHPCLYKGADQRIWKDRSLIKIEDRELIVNNYIHNYEDDLRMGEKIQRTVGIQIRKRQLYCPYKVDREPW